MIYFDNAATSMHKPKKVITELVNSVKNHGNPGRGGYPVSMNAAQKIFNARLSLSNFFKNDSPENVIFTQNATMSLNIAVKCFAESRVLISCFEHNSVYRPVYNNFKHDIFDVSLSNDEETVRSALHLIRDDTSMIVITHVSNVCGKILPVREITAKAKEKKPDIITVVDAAQSAGVLDIDMRRDNIDILCVPAHKSMLGIAGLGIMLLNNKLKIPETAFIEGGTGTNSLDKIMPADLPEHFEAGTPNTPAIAALSAAVEYIDSEGVGKIYEHEKKLYDKAVDMLDSLENIKLYGDFSNSDYIGAILFNINNIKCEEAAKILARNNIFVRDGYHCTPLAHEKLGTIRTGGVRISFGYHNTVKQLDKLYKVLKNM
jgi:cysteine desulfurase family protein